MNDLEIDALRVRAGQTLVVDGVSMTARAKEITVVIGPNGAGKTSLLEAIVGLRPREGSVRLGGARLERFADHARTFAFMPDEGELAPEAMVATLLRDAANTRGRRDDAETEQSTGWMRALNVQSLMDAPAGMLSRGERQRVALTLTLMQRRPVIVLDEPFAAFDPLRLRDVLSAVRDVAAKGTIVVASVHQLADAEKIADRVLLLAAGRAVAFGTIDELRDRAEAPAASLEEIFVRLLARDRDAA